MIQWSQGLLGRADEVGAPRPAVRLAPISTKTAGLRGIRLGLSTDEASTSGPPRGRPRRPWRDCQQALVAVLGLLLLLTASRFFLAEWLGFAVVAAGAWVFAVALVVRRGAAAQGGLVQIIERGPDVITGDRLRSVLLRLSQQRKRM